MALNGFVPTAQELARDLGHAFGLQGHFDVKVLRQLIDETLQIQEAAANDITVDENQVERTYAQVAQQNFRRDTAALDKYLASIGSSPRSLKRQIRGELAWQRLLGRNVTPFINVSEEEVNEVIARLKANKGTEEYRIGEIYLSANSQNRAEVAQNAQQIVQQLKQGLTRARGGRERFFWQLSLARLCYQAKKYELAKTQLEALDQQLEASGPGSWEPDLALEVLRLLHSC